MLTPEQSDRLLIRNLCPAHLTEDTFEAWCRAKADAEGCDPYGVAREYALAVIRSEPSCPSVSTTSPDTPTPPTTASRDLEAAG